MKKMKLRYAGTCRECLVPVKAGEPALYDRAAKNVLCLVCAAAVDPIANSAAVVPADPHEVASTRSGAAPASLPHVHPKPAEEVRPVPVQGDAVLVGSPGASARREHVRRKDRREQRVRSAHPHIGGIILALSDDPQSTRAWEVGARGEEILGNGLNALTDRGVHTLHDRRVPRTKANIDHIAVAASGVYVIDAKRYQGRPTLRVEGGLFRPRTEKLMVGGRDRTKLVAGLDKQVRLVRDALSQAGELDVPVHGMLCFVGAGWPLIGGSFCINDHEVLWPKKAFSQLSRSGPLDAGRINVIQRALADAFPAA